MADWSVEKLPLGRTGLSVSRICIGTSPLGSAPQLYGYEVNEARAVPADAPNAFAQGASDLKQGNSTPEQAAATVVDQYNSALQ